MTAQKKAPGEDGTPAAHVGQEPVKDDPMSTLAAMNPDADSSLVDRMRAGDESALVEVMQRHRDKIYRRVLRMLKSEDDAQEITQDVFIRAHRSIGNFRGEASLSTWLRQIATNLAHNRYWYWWRRKKGQTMSLDQPLGDDTDATVYDIIPMDAPHPGEETVTQELVDKVADGIQQLPELHREILIMRIQKSMAYDDIAERLGISVGTVKSRIARARTSLRKLMGVEFE